MPKIIERAMEADLKPEDARKVNYICEQVLYGKRDAADEAMLLETLGRIVK